MFNNGLRTRYSPRVATGADHVGSRREALNAELAHESDVWGGLDDLDSVAVRPTSKRTYGPTPVATTATDKARELDSYLRARAMLPKEAQA